MVRGVTVLFRVLATLLVNFTLTVFVLAIILFPYLALAYSPANKTTVGQDMTRIMSWWGQRWRRGAPSNKHMDVLMDKVRCCWLRWLLLCAVLTVIGCDVLRPMCCSIITHKSHSHSSHTTL